MRTLTVRFCPSGETLSVPEGTPLASLASRFEGEAAALAAIKVNNETQSLSQELHMNASLSPLYLDTHEGQTIYRKTLSFVLGAAAEGIFKDGELVIGHSLGYAFYYSLAAGQLESGKIAQLEAKMRALIDADLPIEFRLVSYSEARQLLAGRADTALLLEQRNEALVPVYQCGEYTDLASSALLASTGKTKTFALTPYKDGFLLRFPATGGLGRLAEFRDEPRLFDVYYAYKAWGRIVGVHSAGHLNRLVTNGEIREFIQIAEAVHEKRLFEIAADIYARREKVKVVLIAGPSSAGKTTTAKRLSIALKVMGIEPIPVSLDNYYLNPALAPKDKNGKPDLECVEALDVPFLNEQLAALLGWGEVTLPIFDFKTKERKEGKKIKLGRRSMLILEGIHALNDRLTPGIDASSRFKLYVSALTQLNIDGNNRVSTSDNRLLRRIVRDYNFRGSDAGRSLSMWESVRAGEQKHIFPFQNSADAIFNSALDYEIPVLRFYAEPILRQVKPDREEYSEAVRLMRFLANFTPISPQYVPTFSILREFTGGSGFKY